MSPVFIRAMGVAVVTTSAEPPRMGAQPEAGSIQEELMEPA